VKRDEGVVIVYMVKWQCSFKYSWSRYRVVKIGYCEWDGDKSSVLQCNLETRTRESAGRCGAWGMLPPVRLEDWDTRPCTLRGKRYCFRRL